MDIDSSAVNRKARIKRKPGDIAKFNSKKLGPF
jgi:hypothetical protein